MSYFQKVKQNPGLYAQDLLLITIMAVLAACGLIYQYLLSHYAGRVLGMMEHAIYTMIGVMIVSMGVGAFWAKYFKQSETAFAWLESIIALLGATGLLIIGGAFAFALWVPLIISQTFGIPLDMIPHGGFVAGLIKFAKIVPFIIGFLIGTLIGMEIPFIARIRERLYGQHLEHNVGTIYGADYIGAGVGAAIFIVWMLSLDPNKAALITASANLISGIIFFVWQYKYIQRRFWLGIMNVGLVGMILLLANYSLSWQKTFENFFYQDPVIASVDTPYQHMTITRSMPRQQDHQPIFSLYLNGRTQFTSMDEFIYHDFLVQPAMLAANRTEHVLIIGGGDGLALRDVLEWNPKQVTLVDLDQDLVELFSEPAETPLEEELIALNNKAFSNQNVRTIFGDAFNVIDDLRMEGAFYDVILVDLPDPSHPDLNKLYSQSFYQKLKALLTADGAIAVQSTSPYHATAAFLTVGVTMKAAGFENVERYHANVPSFGEWGWTVATPIGLPPSQRIMETDKILPSPHWVSKEQILGAFAFNSRFFEKEDQLIPNSLNNQKMYQLHRDAWLQDGKKTIATY